MRNFRVLTVLIGLMFGVGLQNGVALLAANKVLAASSGTVSVLRSSGKIVLIVLHTTTRRATTLTLASNARVTTADNHVIQPGDIRLGDRLVLSTAGSRSSKPTGGVRVQDTSQRQMLLSGIVAFAPGTPTGSMAVQTSKNGDIAVNLSSSTRYADSTHQTTALDEVEEADEVRMLGIVDVALGEMTHTETVTRWGPVVQKSKSTKP